MTATALPRSIWAKYRQYIELFVASFLGLYFEMLVVRWLAAEVRLFSYFKNLTMMAAFMGLGIGFAISRRRRSTWRWFIPLLLLYVPIVLVVGYLTGFRPLVGKGLTLNGSPNYADRWAVSSKPPRSLSLCPWQPMTGLICISRIAVSR